MTKLVEIVCSDSSYIIAGNRFEPWKQTGCFSDAATNLQFVQGKKQLYRKAGMILNLPQLFFAQFV